MANLRTVKAGLAQVRLDEKSLEKSRRALVDECRAAREEGHSYTNIAKAAEVSVLTLRCWLGVSKR